MMRDIEQNDKPLEGARDVSQQLYNLLKQWEYCDLIVDRELSSPLTAELAQPGIDQLSLPINPKGAALPIARCRLLVRLSLAQLELLDASVSLSVEQNTQPVQQVRAIGGWLFSNTVPQERLARRLEQAIIVHIEDGPQALLRIWDPRVIGHLERILTPLQLADLMGPITCWAWLDRAGQLRMLNKPQLAEHATMSIFPLRLTAGQSAAIDRIEEINRLLRTLALLGHAIPPARDAELDALLVQAQRKGHTEQDDALAYCLHALLISERFDEIPAVQQAIAQAHADGRGLCSAIEQFDDVFWAAHADAAAATT